MINVTYRVNVPWLSPCQGSASLIGQPTVKKLLGIIGMEAEQGEGVLVVVNGKNRLAEDLLEEGDQVIILPALCGG